MSTNKSSKGIPVPSKIPSSGRDSGTHSRSSSVSNLTTASDMHSEAGDAMSENTHGFKVDDRVWVNGSKPGHIKFLGKTQFAPGLWAGIILDEAVGKNDGSVAGVKYFSCEPLKGIFARPSKLSKSSGAISGTGDIPGNSSVTPRATGAVTPISSRLAGSTASLSSSRGICSRLRCGERVMVSSTSGMKSGILRYLGETDFAKGEWAGIELDEPVGKNDGSVAGKRYFNCKMKYGLFSPLHKVSRAGGTSTPRAPSVRGTPLMRSTSRDSLSSSVSSSSKASRVKLGITSLTNSQQKARTTGGIGIMTTSRALEEALKEKEQHIEQLLKEHDLERTEVAKVTSRCEELETKCSELLKYQQKVEEDRKNIEQQLCTDKRKLEDLQFQLEEEKIVKSDLEMQMQQQKQLLKRLEDFLNEKLDSKFINIKEILEGKENLSEISEKAVNDPQIEIYLEKITNLETNLASSIEETNKNAKELYDTKLLLDTSKNKNEELLISLNTTIQEKDDVISNLKTELSAQLEKLTNIIEDNKNLNMQINLQANEAKGQTDEIIKELGEKIKSLTEELNVKSSCLQDCEISIQEKDSQLSSYSNSLESQAQQLSEIQNQNKILQQDLEQKSSELAEKATIQKSLEDKITNLKSQVGSEISEKDEKILGLVTDLERITNSLQEKEDEVAHKQTEVSSLQEKVKELTEINDQMQLKMKETEENVSTVSKDGFEKVSALQTEINLLKEYRENITSKFEKKLKTMQAGFEKLSQEHKNQTTTLAEKDSQVLSLTQTLSEKETEFLKLQNELIEVKQICAVLSEEKTNFVNSLKTKEESLSEFEKQIDDLKSLEQKRIKELSEKQQEIDSLQNTLKQANEENVQLNSKLQLAEQNVEMLNKDSSEHVMTLQNELSKLKDENTKNKTALEHKIAELQKEHEKVSNDMSERNSVLAEKDETLSALKQEVTAKENDLSTLSSQVEQLEKDISELIKSKEELQTLHENQLLSTKAEFDSELKKKETKLSEVLQECDNLTKTVNEKCSALTEKEEALLTLQNHIKEKEVDVCNSSALTDKLKQELDTLTRDKESLLAVNEKQIQVLRQEFDLELEKKEQLIKECQLKISACSELLESKDKDLFQKESNNNSLRNSLNEKESQFDELSQMIESSQAQLKKLNEQNENNAKLLQSKEAFFNDFKAEQEKQILELKENFKAESSKLQELVLQHENDIKQKSDIILKLNTEAEKQMNEIKLLHEELEKSKANNEKAILNTSEIHKDFIDKIADLEAKYSQVLEEKKKVEAEEQKSREAKKSLEEAKNSLLQEKVQKEEIVKDREAKLEALQAEVNRMQTDFTLHKQELQQKLDVSEMELQAALELKNQLELQHSVLEELQQDLHNSEEKCKSLEAQVKNMSALTSEKTGLVNKLAELENQDREKSEKIIAITSNYQAVEESLKSNQICLAAKEKECVSLNEKVKVLETEQELKEVLQKSLRSLEQENILLHHKIEKLEKHKTEKNANETVTANTNQDDAEERDTLLSQIDFLNSIIVDMKQKNETLQLEIETLKMGPTDIDSNLNNIEKKIAPRLYCDICEMFDLHDTDDCPKQESFIADEDVPHLLPQGTRKLEDRPYCNTCEVFGHWTFDCKEEEEY